MLGFTAQVCFVLWAVLLFLSLTENAVYIQRLSHGFPPFTPAPAASSVPGVLTGVRVIASDAIGPCPCRWFLSSRKMFWFVGSQPVCRELCLVRGLAVVPVGASSLAAIDPLIRAVPQPIPDWRRP